MANKKQSLNKVIKCQDCGKYKPESPDVVGVCEECGQDVLDNFMPEQAWSVENDDDDEWDFYQYKQQNHIS